MNKPISVEQFKREFLTGLEVYMSNPVIEFDFSYIEHIAELMKGVKW